MKNNILIFLLGIFVTISIAATVPNTGLLTIKPAIPKATIVLIDNNDIKIKNNINYYLKQGYIVSKLGTLPNYSQVVIILEKY